jgi:hypothetical protein
LGESSGGMPKAKRSLRSIVKPAPAIDLRCLRW